MFLRPMNHMDANQTATGYELKDELARLCLSTARREPERKLAWVNSVCLLFVLVGSDRNCLAVFCTKLDNKCWTTPGAECITGYMFFPILHRLPFAAAKSRDASRRFAAATGLFLLVQETAAPAAEGLEPPCSATQAANAATNLAAPSMLPAAQNGAATGTNSPVALPVMTVIGNLNVAREQIAPDLGAVTYAIDPNQIQVTGQGENSSFQQVLLHAPGVVQDEFGEVHVRGDHGDVQYRVNGVLLPEGFNGFGQEIDPHLINSVTLITGTLPAQFGDRTAGIIDVTTKTGSQLNGNELSLYGGSYDTFHPSRVGRHHEQSGLFRHRLLFAQQSRH